MQQAEQPVSGDAAAASDGVTVARVRFEHTRDTLGIGAARPRLSWVIETDRPGWLQVAYEVAVLAPEGHVRDSTGRVSSGESVLVAWPFAPLRSRERVSVRVRVWGDDGSASDWSDAYPVEAGLLHSDDWSARFIAPGWAEDTSRPGPSPMVRCEFTIKPGLARARLYVTALGVYDAEINGMRVGDEVLSPGWTSYAHRLTYRTFDVAPLLHEGPNAIGAILGDGWYRGRLGFGGGHRNLYGDRLALLAQLELEYADGTAERLMTDEHWRAATGPILASDLYDGEAYDARLERPGWSTPGFDDGDWSQVVPVQHVLATLVAPTGPPVRRIELVTPVAITRSPSGRVIVDFGQNLVGRIRLTARGDAGHTITLRHAEVLEDGELGTRPLRTARATDRYTTRGGAETWEPRFTFHGFRYVEVTGWPGELALDDLRAVVLSSDLERTGWFTCSDPLINQLHENVVWSMRGNFLSIPTDCPQRDERLGWTGDIQIFTPTASFLYDVAGFLQSWLSDLAAEQQAAGGVVPVVVPCPLDREVFPAAAWGDAAVVVPWVLYRRYGDTGMLAAQFASMRAWVDAVARLAGADYLWDEGFQFGDWLDPAAPPDRPAAGRTDPHLVATAYFAHSAQLTGEAAGILGRTEDETFYLDLAARVRSAFADAYLLPDGTLPSTTAHALALQFALLPDEAARRRAGAELAALVRESDYHISTGFVGTPLVCDALCSVGAYDAAYRLLTQRECPSWLYPVTMGATTIWERWDSMRPDGSINPGEMTSFNHYALGAVADWLHRVVAGLAPAAPGYKSFEIRPVPGGGLNSAGARHVTPYGEAACRWQIDDGAIRVDVQIPPNTTAKVTLPGHPGDAGQGLAIGAGRHHWSYPFTPGATLPGAREPGGS